MMKDSNMLRCAFRKWHGAFPVQNHVPQLRLIVALTLLGRRQRPKNGYGLQSHIYDVEHVSQI